MNLGLLPAIRKFVVRFLGSSYIIFIFLFMVYVHKMEVPSHTIGTLLRRHVRTSRGYIQALTDTFIQYEKNYINVLFKLSNIPFICKFLTFIQKIKNIIISVEL